MITVSIQFITKIQFYHEYVDRQYVLCITILFYISSLFHIFITHDMYRQLDMCSRSLHFSVPDRGHWTFLFWTLDLPVLDLGPSCTGPWTFLFWTLEPSFPTLLYSTLLYSTLITDPLGSLLFHTGPER